MFSIRYDITRIVQQPKKMSYFRRLTPLPLETRFWGQNYLYLVKGGVRGAVKGLRSLVIPETVSDENCSYLYRSTRLRWLHESTPLSLLCSLTKIHRLGLLENRERLRSLGTTLIDSVDSIDSCVYHPIMCAARMRFKNTGHSQRTVLRIKKKKTRTGKKKACTLKRERVQEPVCGEGGVWFI